MNDCIFCKILNKKLDASFVYQTDNITSFMDIAPINKGHVLVVPNVHYQNFTSIDSKTTAEMFVVAQKILKAIKQSNISCEGANIFLSDGEIAGQEVPHSHLHIAPRFKGDGHRMGFSGTNSSEGKRTELDLTASTIREFL